MVYESREGSSETNCEFFSKLSEAPWGTSMSNALIRPIVGLHQAVQVIEMNGLQRLPHRKGLPILPARHDSFVIRFDGLL